MAINKLKDIYDLKPEYGVGGKALDIGKYKYVRQADIDSKVFNKRVNKGPFLSNGDILISRAGAYAGKTYIHNSGDDHVFAGFLVRYSFKKDILLNKYFYLWSKTKKYTMQMLQLRTGAVQPNFNPGSVGELRINIPSIAVQQKIIDIIEPVENLFLKYSNCVRIDAINNARNDVQKIIDIIEPFEKYVQNINNLIYKIRNMIIDKYRISNGNIDLLSNYFTSSTNKYNGQSHYLATNAVGELNIDTCKIQNIINEKPTRANLTPRDNSIIFSKLEGENKLLFIDSSFDYVVSTGFFNISSHHIDHMMGFMLSNSFKVQKKIFSSGTTMRGLNKKSLEKIKIKIPNDNDRNLTILITKLNSLKLKIEFIRDKIVRLIVK